MSEGYPFWSDAEFDSLRLAAKEIFVARYKREIQASFRAVETECAAEVRKLLDATDLLSGFGDDPNLFDERPELLRAARYVTAPVISKDTLDVVGEADGPVETVRQFIDRARFPWLDERRTPEAESPEVDAAVAMTAKLMAEQRLGTKLRGELSATQEATVRDALEGAGLEFVEPTVIRGRLASLGDSRSGVTAQNYQEALGRGEYTKEIQIAGAKCDVPARLPNGTLLPIECKVSNTAVNSIKRLNRETGGKHDRWKGAFGARLHTGAVLGGVFNLVNLQAAQSEGLAIFFDHDLDALTRFIEAGGEPRPAP